MPVLFATALIDKAKESKVTTHYKEMHVSQWRCRYHPPTPCTNQAKTNIHPEMISDQGKDLDQ